MTKKFSKARQGGFTLIEILIVIGIIAILAAIVLVAVNPAKHFREAANAQRSANVNSILNAIGQYTVDEKGVLPPGLDNGDFALDEMADGQMTEFEEFCKALVPAYIGALPADPNEADQNIDKDQCDDNGVDTGYAIKLDNGRVTICAPDTIDVDDGGAAAEDICVTR